MGGGASLQVIGYWTSNRWVAFLLPVPLFALIHAPSNVVPWLGYLTSGLCFALVAMFSQGIAASTVLHFVSKMTLILLSTVMDLENQGNVSLILIKSLLLVSVTALFCWREVQSRGADR
ncbi:CPBP family intramembrane glutamic endopeptidase [Corynebacterium sp. H128]|uniref:CPBP family intramembrane glutamic endopeptidase n=1 Tax=unclassified Corynebacterium TaxID=2624378 RepID=UPI00403EF9B7